LRSASKTHPFARVAATRGNANIPQPRPQREFSTGVSPRTCPILPRASGGPLTGLLRVWNALGEAPWRRTPALPGAGRV